jgi:hypothetical protein
MDLHEFVVPAQNYIQDTVVLGRRRFTILFEVSVPSVTPPNDIVYIHSTPSAGWNPSPCGRLAITAGHINFTARSISSALFHTVIAATVNAEAQTMFKRSAHHPQATGTTSLIGQDIQDTVNAWKWFERSQSHLSAQAYAARQIHGRRQFNLPPLGHILHLAFANPRRLGQHVTLPQAGHIPASHLWGLRPFPDKTRCGLTLRS